MSCHLDVGPLFFNRDADFLFQQDLAPAGNAKTTTNQLDDHEITVLGFTINSPDVNSIKNPWAVVRSKMTNT